MPSLLPSKQSLDYLRLLLQLLPAQLLLVGRRRKGTTPTPAFPALRDSLALCGVEVTSLSEEDLQKMEAAFAADTQTASITTSEALLLREQLSLPTL